MDNQPSEQPSPAEPSQGEQPVAQPVQPAEVPQVTPQAQTPIQPTGQSQAVPEQTPTTQASPQPVVNNQNIPVQTPVSGGSTVSKPKSKKKWVFIIIILIIILVVVGGAYWYMKKQNSPATIFKDALTNSLSTSSVQQTNKDSVGDSGVIKYQLSNVKSPVVSSSVNVNQSGVKISLDGYGSLQNTYLNFTNLSLPTLPSSLNTGSNKSVAKSISKFLNKWIAIRQNGNLPSNVDLGTDPYILFSDPRALVFGQFIFGNFSVGDRAVLLNYLLDNDVYKYDSSKVTTTTINGSKVDVYKVTLDTSKLKTFNQKVANAMGISTSDPVFLAAISGLATGPTSATMYINTSTKQLIRETSAVQGVVTTVDYSNYNSLTLPKEPTAELTYTQLNGLINTLSNIL